MNPRLMPGSETVSDLVEVSREFRSTDDDIRLVIEEHISDVAPTFRVPLRTSDEGLEATLRRTFSLRTRSESESGHDAPKPSETSIARADLWILEFYNEAARMHSWLDPHVTADEDGDVVFEWWNKNKKLTVYVTPDAVEYIKVEHPAASSDMEDGIVETAEDRRQLWRWLVG